MRAAGTAAAAVLVAVAVAGPATAATPSPLPSAPSSPSPSPSPSPEDRATTLTVSPPAGPDRTSVLLRGFSDCAVIDGHLLFTTYDGKADNVVVRRTSTTYDDAREKYPYAIRLTVPATAAPGTAKAYVEPFCGPPEEYPASAVVPFRVELAALALRLSPTRPPAGGRLRIRARTCDGSRGTLTIRVRSGDVSTDVRGAVDATGVATASVRVTAPGEVSLPNAATECRGSSYAGAVAYALRAAVAASAGGPSAASSPPPTAASAAASPGRTPLPGASPSVAAAPGPAGRTGGGRGPLLGAAAAALVAAAAGAVWLTLRRRRPAT